MANKRITDVDFIDSLESNESFFVNQNNTLKQINKGDVVFEIVNGGTGATTAEEALKNLGLTATAMELNYADGVTSNIQTQLNNKASSSHNHDSLYLKTYALNAIDIDSTQGNWTVDISEEGHGTVPSVWVNVTQTSAGHFLIQTAVKCNKDTNTARTVGQVWMRDKYRDSDWSSWTRMISVSDFKFTESSATLDITL